MSDYKKKRKALTPELWDWIQAKHRAGWDACYIAEDSGVSRQTVWRVLNGRQPRPEESRDDEDRCAYTPTPSELRREACKLRAARLAELRAMPHAGGHCGFGAIREVSLHGHRRASTVGGTT